MAAIITKFCLQAFGKSPLPIIRHRFELMCDYLKEDDNLELFRKLPDISEIAK